MIKTRLLRKISERTLFLWLKDTKIMPQHLLIFRIIFAIVTGVILFTGDFLLGAIFLTAYQIVFLLDYVDGKIARYKKIFSPKWRRVDRTAHYMISAIFLFAITFSYFRASLNELIFLTGTIGTLSILLTLIVDSIILERHLDFDKLKKIQDKRGFFTNFYSFLPIDGSFTLFYFLFMFKLHTIAIIFLSVMYFLIFLKKTFTMIKWKGKK